MAYECAMSFSEVMCLFWECAAPNAEVKGEWGSLGYSITLQDILRGCESNSEILEPNNDYWLKCSYSGENLGMIWMRYY